MACRGAERITFSDRPPATPPRAELVIIQNGLSQARYAGIGRPSRRAIPLHLNGDWHDFMDYRIACEQDALYGQAA